MHAAGNRLRHHPACSIIENRVILNSEFKITRFFVLSGYRRIAGLGVDYFTGFILLHRLHDEGEGAVAVLQAVLWKRNGAPAVDAA